MPVSGRLTGFTAHKNDVSFDKPDREPSYYVNMWDHLRVDLVLLSLIIIAVI